MRNTKLSRAEELSLQSKKDEKKFLTEKNHAQSERATQIGNLKALRLEKEAAERRATRKLARAVQKKSK